MGGLEAGLWIPSDRLGFHEGAGRRKRRKRRRGRRRKKEKERKEEKKERKEKEEKEEKKKDRKKEEEEEEEERKEKEKKKERKEKEEEEEKEKKEGERGGEERGEGEEEGEREERGGEEEKGEEEGERGEEREEREKEKEGEEEGEREGGGEKASASVAQRPFSIRTLQLGQPGCPPLPSSSTLSPLLLLLPPLAMLPPLPPPGLVMVVLAAVSVWWSPIPGGLAGPVQTCEAQGSLYYVGEWYFPERDPCTQCECTAQGPACARTDCAALPPACVHVSHYPSDCCPRCEQVGCEHRGQVYPLGQHFQPSECEQCTCDLDGIARCLVADCAPPPCVNPIYEKGHCCPTCKDGPNCYVDGSQRRVIPAGESIWVGPCTRCRCHDGQDAGYWEGNRLAKCERLRGCRATAGH